MKASIALIPTLAGLALAAPAMAAPSACPPVHAQPIHRIATHHRVRRTAVRTVYVTQYVRVPVEVPIEVGDGPSPIYESGPVRFVRYDYGWSRGGIHDERIFADEGGFGGWRHGGFHHDGGYWRER